MSSSNRSIDYLTENEAQFRKVRRPASSGNLVGYQPENDELPRSIPGDAKFPFVMQPPDLEAPELYRQSTFQDNGAGVLTTTNPLPLVTIGSGPSGYQDLRALDVRGFRTLAVYCTYTAGDSDPELIGAASLLPEVGISVDAAPMWFSTGVVDSALIATGVAPALDSVDPPMYAYRTMYRTELRIETLQENVAAPGTPTSLVANFDVSAFATFRLRVADVLATGSALTVYTARMR